jgi:dTDP-4-dehydrorhamnose 3,5-epimerase-like enzyme
MLPPATSTWVEFPLVDLPSLADERGGLVALEGLSAVVPFAIQRVYYLHHTQAGVTRGKHAHKALQQVLIAVAGQCQVMLDDGLNRQNYWLDSPLRGLYVGPKQWREMLHFSPDCVLLVLASLPYDEADYIREYNTFLTWVQPSHERIQQA